MSLGACHTPPRWDMRASANPLLVIDGMLADDHLFLLPHPVLHQCPTVSFAHLALIDALDVESRVPPGNFYLTNSPKLCRRPSGSFLIVWYSQQSICSDVPPCTHTMRPGFSSHAQACCYVMRQLRRLWQPTLGLPMSLSLTLA